LHKLKYFFIPLVLGIIIASCEKDDNTVIDPVLNFPRLDSANLNPNSFDSSRININFSAYVTSIDPISSVTAKITNPDGQILNTINLTESGSVYTGTYDTLMSCRLVGSYRVEFIAMTNSGLPSNTISNNFSVTNSQNIKPSISIIYCPDSLRRPAAGLDSAFLKVHVSDPNGECDILSTYFNSFNPSGIPSPANPFLMYDDGDVTPPHCDTIANDGNYSLQIYIFPTPQTYGNYIFKFNAQDRSLIVSDTLTKLINIHP